MICLDTTFLIDAWRVRGKEDTPTRRYLSHHAGEEFVVPVTVIGEFLEGAANISEERLLEARRYVRAFRPGNLRFETANHYARIVADLRSRDQLKGVSKAHLWIAAFSIEQGAMLATRNLKHFQRVKGLRVESYD